jgi:hypothetical protein
MDNVQKHNICSKQNYVCLDYPSTLNIEAIHSSETSVDIYQIKLRYIRDDRTINSHRQQNSESCTFTIVLSAQRQVRKQNTWREKSGSNCSSECFAMTLDNTYLL